MLMTLCVRKLSLEMRVGGSILIPAKLPTETAAMLSESSRGAIYSTPIEHRHPLKVSTLLKVMLREGEKGRKP